MHHGYTEEKETAETDSKTGSEEFSASHLPPRSEYHRRKKAKAKEKDSQEKQAEEQQKVKYPIIKILAFIFLLLPFVIGAYYYFQVIKNDSTPVHIEADDNTGFDQVEIEDPYE
ncbi:hypothetical protein OEV98_09200 [Caldibacillus lycopersici]|uniref:Uncharacterized protein n=1 Tax=Perspicuibacillus lycopersici TaxID=1325689 RepID=A0AAE3LND3_9BACI|nr:hypothetical protein [Perspicuibacillus lycopersici]MCU9613737.1 hypothetical protein [Perspicuibacillus lycopersici]